jgi:hypothetical protein
MVFMLLLATFAAVSAQISVTNTFTSGTTISSSQVNQNFSDLASQALNRTAGTMTGTLTSRNIVPDGNNTRDLGGSGTRWASIYGVLGNFSGAVIGTTFTATSTQPVLALYETGVTADNGRWDFLADAEQLSLRIINDAYTSQGIALHVNRTGTSLENMTFGSSTPAASTGYTFTGSFPYAAGVYVNTTLSAPSAVTSLAGFWTGGTIVEYSSGNHSLLAGARFDAPTITEGSATVTNAATMYITAATSATVSGDNYALFVDAGNTRLDGDVAVGGRINSATAQPGFLAYNSADDTSVSGTATVEFDTEVYDTASNFNTTTDTFTAPITGYYLLCASLQYSDNDASSWVTRIVTSNRSYTLTDTVASAGGSSGCVIADMDFSDTAFVQVVVGDITAQIEGGSSPYPTFFSGRLMP